MRKLLVAGLAAALVAVPGMAPAATTPPAPVATPAPENPVAVSITSATVQPDGTLDVVGVATARSAVLSASADLYVGGALVTRSQLQGLTDSAEVTVNGPRTTAELGDLSSGSSVPFHLTTPGRLDDTRVTPVRVEVVTVDARERTTSVGGLTTTVVSFAAPPPGALRTSWVIPLTAAPSLSPDGTFTDDTRTALTTELRGRLSVPLAVAEKATPAPVAAGGTPGSPQLTPVTLAVDPALLEAVQLLAGETTTPAGSKDGGTSDEQAAAQGWLKRIRADVELSTVAVAALPYADADLDALQRANDDVDRTAAVGHASDDVAAALNLQSTAVSSELLVPAGGEVGDATLATAVADRTRLAVLSDVTLPAVPAARTPSSVTRLTVDGRTVPVLVTDGVVQDLVTAADGGSTDAGVTAQAVRRYDAELAQIVAELPNASPAHGLVVVAPRRWTASADYAVDAVTAATSGAWSSPTTVKDLADDPATVRKALVDDASSAIAPADVAAVVAGRGRLDDLRALLPSPSGISGTEQAPDTTVDPSASPSPTTPAAAEPSDAVVTPLARALVRGVSSWWRLDPGGGDAARAQVKARIEERLQSVRIGVSRTVLLTGEEGNLPVQVANGLPSQVTVRLTLMSVDGNRLETVMQDVTVPAASGTSTTFTQVSLRLRSRTSGRFPATLQLSTTTGASLAEPVSLVVRVGGAGKVALAITFTALGVLGLLLVRRAFLLLRRRRLGLQGAGS